MMPRWNRLLSLALLLVILGAGVGIGIGVDRLWLRPAGSSGALRARLGERRARSPEQRATRLAKRFRDQLGLDEAQTGQVIAVLKRMFDRTRTLRKTRRQELRTVRDAHRAEIRRVLTPAQRVKFDQLVQAYEKRRAAGRRRR